MPHPPMMDHLLPIPWLRHKCLLPFITSRQRWKGLGNLCYHLNTVVSAYENLINVNFMGTIVLFPPWLDNTPSCCYLGLVPLVPLVVH